jgi:hypothetical protein
MSPHEKSGSPQPVVSNDKILISQWRTQATRLPAFAGLRQTACQVFVYLLTSSVALIFEMDAPFLREIHLLSSQKGAIIIYSV